VVTAGIIGGLIAVPLLAVLNTAIRYLDSHPTGDPTPDRAPPGTRPTDRDEAAAEDAEQRTAERADSAAPPTAESSVDRTDADQPAPARTAAG
jgi:hypothetical protein